MGPFLADSVSPRLVWISTVAIAIALGGSILVCAPSPTKGMAQTKARPVGRCIERAAKPAPAPVRPTQIYIATWAAHSVNAATMLTATESALAKLGRFSTAPAPNPHDSSLIVPGFHIDGTLDAIETKHETDKNLDGIVTVNVTCKLRLEASTYPEKATFAFVSASARVTASRHTTESELELSRAACISAAIDDAIEQVIPAIEARARK